MNASSWSWVTYRAVTAAEEVAEIEDQALDETAVERPERLVEHQEPGRRRQRPGQGDPLLLSPGQRGDRTLLESGKAHPIEHLGHTVGRRHSGHAGHPEPKADVADHIEMGEQGVVLEHEPEIPPVGRDRRRGRTRPIALLPRREPATRPRP